MQKGAEGCTEGVCGGVCGGSECKKVRGGSECKKVIVQRGAWRGARRV